MNFKKIWLIIITCPIWILILFRIISLKEYKKIIEDSEKLWKKQILQQKLKNGKSKDNKTKK